MRARPLHDKLAELKARGPKPVNYERIEPKAWGPSSHTVADVKLLRGRVLVKPLDVLASSVIILPQFKTDQKTLGRGRVVAMGPPKLDKKGNEIPHGFSIGEIVLHVGQHRSRDVELADGTYRSVAQDECLAVVTGEDIDTHGGPADYRELLR